MTVSCDCLAQKENYLLSLRFSRRFSLHPVTLRHLYNGRLEERMSSNKAADHMGHLQELLVALPFISTPHLVLSYSNYH